MKIEEKELVSAMTAELRRLISGGAAEPLTGRGVPEPELEELRTAVNGLITSLTEAREYISGLAAGNLQVEPPMRNFLASPFKQLHAGLMHLTWQAGRIAEGDYSQRVDFMGDFSSSFNEMVDALAEKQRVEESLREARAEVKQLRGIIPICMYCKKIRNDGDYWEKLETYISEHADVLFSHGICPDCLQRQFKKKT